MANSFTKAYFQSACTNEISDNKSKLYALFLCKHDIFIPAFSAAAASSTASLSSDSSTDARLKVSCSRSLYHWNSISLSHEFLLGLQRKSYKNKLMMYLACNCNCIMDDRKCIYQYMLTCCNASLCTSQHFFAASYTSLAGC